MDLDLEERANCQEVKPSLHQLLVYSLGQGSFTGLGFWTWFSSQLSCDWRGPQNDLGLSAFL